MSKPLRFGSAASARRARLDASPAARRRKPERRLRRQDGRRCRPRDPRADRAQLQRRSGRDRFCRAGGRKDARRRRLPGAARQRLFRRRALLVGRSGLQGFADDLFQPAAGRPEAGAGRDRARQEATRPLRSSMPAASSSMPPTTALRWRSPAARRGDRGARGRGARARAPTPRVRQNLALAHALAGDWTEAGRSPRRTCPPTSSTRASSSGCSSPARRSPPTRSPRSSASRRPRSITASRSGSRCASPTRCSPRPRRRRMRRSSLRPLPAQVAAGCSRQLRAAPAPQVRRGRCRRAAPDPGVLPSSSTPAVAPAPRRKRRADAGRDARGCGARRLDGRRARSPVARRGLHAEEGAAVRRATPKRALAPRAAPSAPGDAVVQLGSYRSPQQVTAAWNHADPALSGAPRLPAAARAVRFAQGHLLAPVDPGLQQPARGDRPLPAAEEQRRQLLRPQLRRRRAGPDRLALSATRRPASRGRPSGRPRPFRPEA